MQTIDLTRGYFGIGIYHAKFIGNIGTLYRHAYLYNASFIFTIGNRYKKEKTDTASAHKHIPLYHYEDFEQFKNNMPLGISIIAVELNDNAIRLDQFNHPLNAVYILGAEDYGLPIDILNQCDDAVKLYSPKPQSMNVSATGTLVMYDRIIKQITKNDPMIAKK